MRKRQTRDQVSIGCALRRRGGLVDSKGTHTAFWRRRHALAALRVAIRGRRDQLQLLSVTQAGNLRALGEERARGIPVRGEGAEDADPRALRSEERRVGK